MKRGSIIAGILLLILAAAVWIGSGSFASESAFFPRAVAVAIVVLTTLMLIENQSVQDSVAFDWQQFNYYRTAKIFILTCIYLALLPYIGFLIATTLCLIIMMCVLEKGDLHQQFPANARETLGQRVEPGDQHRARLLRRQPAAQTTTVEGVEVMGQLGDQFGRNRDGAGIAVAGRDAVDRAILGEQAVEEGGAPLYPRPEFGRGIETHRNAALARSQHLIGAQGRGTDGDRVIKQVCHQRGFPASTRSRRS